MTEFLYDDAGHELAPDAIDRCIRGMTKILDADEIRRQYGYREEVQESGGDAISQYSALSFGQFVVASAHVLRSPVQVGREVWRNHMLNKADRLEATGTSLITVSTEDQDKLF